MTVSYTHLDVYKRQVFIGESNISLNTRCCVSPSLAKNFRIKQPVYGIGSQHFIVKKFTSLLVLFCLPTFQDTVDVYKRQEYPLLIGYRIPGAVPE